VLSTGRLLEHWHTGAMSRRASQLDRLEPEAVACLNAKDLAKLGVAPGAAIRVATRRGEIVLKARQDRDVPEGMVFIPFCFAEAAANLLTNPQLDPMGKIPEYKFCAARVEPAEGVKAAAE
jgi:formate dehydrogenase major subunit